MFTSKDLCDLVYNTTQNGLGNHLHLYHKWPEHELFELFEQDPLNIF